MTNDERDALFMQAWEQSTSREAFSHRVDVITTQFMQERREERFAVMSEAERAAYLVRKTLRPV